ncbi:MAG: helix-turn-helix transcriptional regulator [Clostridia bacterium]|nr:helix-turn-helix transcriptional regulator [Clostridia bacterium]
MAISYNRLWKLLIDRNMGKGQLRKVAELSPNTLTKMRKDQLVSMESLCRICDTLHVSLEEIVEYTPESKEG